MSSVELESLTDIGRQTLLLLECVQPFCFDTKHAHEHVAEDCLSSVEWWSYLKAGTYIIICERAYENEP